MVCTASNTFVLVLNDSTQTRYNNIPCVTGTLMIEFKLSKSISLWTLSGKKRDNYPYINCHRYYKNDYLKGNDKKRRYALRSLVWLRSGQCMTFILHSPYNCIIVMYMYWQYYSGNIVMTVVW